MNPTGRTHRSSAATRRHHHTHLPRRLDAITVGIHTVLVLPDRAGDTVHEVIVYDALSIPINLQPEQTARVLGLLQGAFTADWSLIQVWRRASNTLTAETPMRGAA